MVGKLSNLRSNQGAIFAI